MQRKVLFWFLAGAGLLIAGVVWTTSHSGAQNPDNGGKAKGPESPLPIRQVVLFNSGVGYFQREGDVNGDARIDLTFPVGDINDLLKSLVLQDLGGGRISSVNYDSQDPIDKIRCTLRTRSKQHSRIRPNPQPGARRENRNPPPREKGFPSQQNHRHDRRHGSAAQTGRQGHGGG